MGHRPRESNPLSLSPTLVVNEHFIFAIYSPSSLPSSLFIALVCFYGTKETSVPIKQTKYSIENALYDFYPLVELRKQQTAVQPHQQQGSTRGVGMQHFCNIMNQNGCRIDRKGLFKKT